MNYADAISFLRDFLPVRMEVQVGSMVSVVCSVFTFFCGWNAALEALLGLMMLDYITGVMAAYFSPAHALNSQRGFKGILKKVLILMIVATAHFVDEAIGQEIVQVVVIWFYAGNEGLSIIENAAKAGIYVPEGLKRKLEQLQDEKRGADMICRK